MKDGSVSIPASVQQAFHQQTKSARIVLLPSIKCVCAAIDLQLFLWKYDR